jgi:hypothetical protein
MRCLVCLALAACTTATADPPAPCKAEPRYDKGSTKFGRFFKDVVVGKRVVDVEKKLGAPTCQSATLRRYWVPDYCSYEKTMVSLWIRAGKVVRVNAVDVITGQECE